MITAIVTAGGLGVRTGNKVPKQFLTVNDVPILVYTLKNISSVLAIGRIVVVVPEGWQGFVKAYVEQYRLDKVSSIVLGGRTRFESIYHGIQESQKTDDARTEHDLIGFFDGNRPLIPASVIEATIVSAQQNGCAVALEPCYDTMVKCEDDVWVTDVLCREKIYKGQCPEFFRKDVLKLLLKNGEQGATKDAPLYVQQLECGGKVAYVKGSLMSFKITTADDIELFKALIEKKKAVLNID